MRNENGWLEAAVAWEVCASIHEKFAKGRDTLYSTRHKDFVKHASDAREKATQKTDSGKCPIGLDAYPRLCSAGVCKVCEAYREGLHDGQAAPNAVLTELVRIEEIRSKAGDFDKYNAHERADYSEEYGKRHAAVWRRIRELNEKIE